MELAGLAENSHADRKSYLVEVALEVKFVFCPNALQASDEFIASSISLSVIQPPLTDASEFLFEPTGDDIYRDASDTVRKTCSARINELTHSYIDRY